MVSRVRRLPVRRQQARHRLYQPRLFGCRLLLHPLRLRSGLRLRQSLGQDTNHGRILPSPFDTPATDGVHGRTHRCRVFSTYWHGALGRLARHSRAYISCLRLWLFDAAGSAWYATRGARNGEMFPLNGPCWSLFFEYIGNIMHALLIRRLSTRLLSLLTVALCCTLTWFAVTDQSGYGSIGVGWTVDSINMLGGSLRMLCPFTAGVLLSRIFKPFNNVRGAFWISTAVLLALLHVPYIGRSYSLGGIFGTLSLNGVFESVCIVAIFPLIVWFAASGKTTDAASTRICRFLGDISYPLYIVHYPLMYAFYRWLIKTEQYTLQETWYVALAVVVSSIVLAWLCLKLYDVPVRKWLRQTISAVCRRPK